LTEYVGQEIYFAIKHHIPVGEPSILRLDTVYISVQGVNDDDEVVEPLATGLIGNFPNPFNPETTIRFVVGGSMFENPHPSPLLVGGGKGEVFGQRAVQIEIFNIRGQKVRTLVNDFHQSGEYTVVWNGRDDNGLQVSSGVYFYRMRAGEYQSVRRMLLMK